MAERLAAKYDLADRAHFSVQAAERLQYPDGEFDVIAGVDILHHVNIENAIRECLRVLKPGGHAIFLEPVEAPAFDRLRHSALVVRFFPTSASLDRHVTEDERKLSRTDLATIRRVAPTLEIEPYLLLSRLDRFHGLNRWTRWSVLERLDQVIFSVLPPSRVLAGKALLRFTKPA
jgi:SAM-dependent methyltransferase